MRLKKKIRLGYNFVMGKLFLRRTPFWIDFKLTDKCNLRCRYCGLWKRNSPEMTTKQIFNLIDESEKDTAFVYLSGGEPLLRKDIKEIIDYIAKKDGIFTVLFTNGTLIKEKINDIKNIDLVNISLDGPREIHDNIRGKGSFDKAIEAIKLLKENKIPVSTETVISNVNIHHLKFITDFAKENKTFCSFSLVHGYKYSGDKNNDLGYSQSEFRKAVAFLKNEKKNNPWIFIPSDKVLDYWSYWPNQPQGYKCYAGTLYCNVNPDGNLTPCFKRTNEVIKRKGNFMKDFQMLKKLAPKTRCSDCFFANQLEYSLSGFADIKYYFNLIKRMRG